MNKQKDEKDSISNEILINLDEQKDERYIELTEDKDGFFNLKMDRKAVLELKRFVQFTDIDQQVINKSKHNYSNHKFLDSFSNLLHLKIATIVGEDDGR